MDLRMKVTIYWSLIGICLIAHCAFCILDIVYGKSIVAPEANGQIPLAAHLITTLTITGSFLFAVLTMNFSSKIFQWIAFIWSILLLLLNAAHLVETIIEDHTNVSQILVVLFVFVINILLTLDLWKLQKENK
ncbi:hypothetical protein [Parabacteroides sp. Marseille-P3160]|uniref:hypothetical protein n=1 Tax=Parabacteroides sp. Marseille-P3160 TaxID=1917887 RepID=UPI00111A51BF|nr:hypothetical protein [Parabacteroides sp. Marseille-P3160]